MGKEPSICAEHKGLWITAALVLVFDIATVVLVSARFAWVGVIIS
jgi:hypothetical protein